MRLDVRAYLQRIASDGPLEPAPALLARLHAAHLLAVPFENLDIHLGRPVRLDSGALFEKIVIRRRGGFCYELNGLFAELLRAAGFRVDLLSAGVARDAGGFGPEFDHLALLVDGRRLADVGFGEGFREPLVLEPGLEQPSGRAVYKLEREGRHWILLRSDTGSHWRPRYRFTLDSHRMSEYEGMCRYHQTSPESSFPRGRVCTLALPDGRITLSEGRFTRTGPEGRTERPVATDEEFRAILRESFGIAIDSPWIRPGATGC